jgi:hypothetical protein
MHVVSQGVDLTAQSSVVEATSSVSGSENTPTNGRTPDSSQTTSGSTHMIFNFSSSTNQDGSQSHLSSPTKVGEDPIASFLDGIWVS